MINTKEKKKVGRMSRFLRFCAFLSVLFFTSNLMAAGYTCSTTPTYLGCKEGYYLSDCGSDETKWTGQSVSSPSAGNSCIACPDGYDCQGTIVCPVTSTVTCTAGNYLDGSTNTCTACPAGSFCKGGEFTLGTTAGISECPLGYRDGTTTGSAAESDCVMSVAAGKYVKTAKESSASGTCASGTFKVAHTVNYGGTSTCSTCPNGYSGSATGAKSVYYCYATCQPGTAVFAPGAICGTQTGAWYTEAEHTVYWNRTSPITYCPYGSVDAEADADHSNSDVCTVSVAAGHYSLLADDSYVDRIRISSTVAFPLVEVQAFYQNEQVSVAYISSQSSGVSNGSYAVNGKLTYNQSAVVPAGGYAVFGVSNAIDEIRFALGSIANVSITVEVDKGDDVWETVFSGTVRPGTVYTVDTNATLQSVMVTDRSTGACEAGTYSSLESDEVSAMLGNVACLAVDAGYWNDGCGTTATGTVCSEDYNGGKVDAGYWNDGCGINATGDVCSTSYKGGQVDAGYYNLGGGTSATPVMRGNGCVNLSSTQCGTIAPGFWGEAGATRYAGTGKVSAGYFSTGGGTSATPGADDCAGNVAIIDSATGKLTGASDVENTCGLIAAGYWNNGAGINAQGGVSNGYEGGQVAAGYFSTGGGRAEEPVDSTFCVDGQNCGLIAAGHWGEIGAGTSAGSGQVNAGYFSTMGGTSPAPNGNGNGCVSASAQCGYVGAGYYSTGGGTTASGTCIEGFECGQIGPGLFSLAGGTKKNPTWFDTIDFCVNAPQNGLTGGSCGAMAPGYYSTGGGTSAQGECLSGNSCGMVAAGYYSAGGAKVESPESSYDCGDDVFSYGCGPVGAGYYSTGGGTSKIPTGVDNGCLSGNTCGQIQLGLYSTCGATADIDRSSTKFISCVDGCDCGLMGAGYYATAGGTSAQGTCIEGNECGTVAPGYYSRGGSGFYQPSGHLCWNYNKYDDGINGCGQVVAGYYSTGGATINTPTAADCEGDNTCGLIAAGYYGAAGATVSTGAGTVNGGYYSTNGGTSATPTANGNGCVGADSKCGKLSAEYYSNGGSTADAATCVSGKTCGTCDTNYRANTETGKTAATQCQASCSAGQRVVSRWKACTSPAGAWYTGAHLVNWGSVSPVNYCMDGYSSTSTSASGHDAVTDCVQTIDGGKYVPSSKINARYVKVTANGSTANDYVHIVEIQAFASNDGTGTNLLLEKGGISGGNLTKATDGKWERGSYADGTMIWDMGSVQSLGSLKFAMYTDGRTYNDVTISVSTDNVTYTTVMGPAEIATEASATPVGDMVVLSAMPESCAAGTYKASGSLALTNTSSCAGCTAGNYCPKGASSQTSCATLDGGLYTNSDAGSGAAEDCYFTTTGGTYLSADGVVTDCEAKYYCPATKLNYPSTGGRYDCPDPTVSANVDAITDVAWLSAACPDATTTNSSIVSANWQSWSNTKLSAKSQCPAIINIDTPCTTFQIQSAKFNTTTGKYDSDGAARIASTVKAGYYFTEPHAANYCTNSPTALMYYKTAAKCTANSYCPGATVPRCDSGEHTYGEPFGIYACTSLGDFYTTSVAGAKANTACYGKTTKTKYVANANDKTESTCAENGYCVGDATVYYGSTGGRTACVAPYGLAAAGSDDANDCYLKTTAGQYVKTAGAGQITCPAGYWCVGNVTIYKGGSVTGRSTTGGSEQCPAGYRDGTTGYSLQSQCTMNVAGGKYVAVVNESSASGTCGLGTYKPAHTVTYGKTSSCDACTGATYADQEGMSECTACPTATTEVDSGLTVDGIYRYNTSDHSKVTNCYTRLSKSTDVGDISAYCYANADGVYGYTYCDGFSGSVCNPGYYYDGTRNYTGFANVIKNVCKPVGESHYFAGGEISGYTAQTRGECETGLVTCGAGLCANEAGDCGRKLHAGNNVIYLRSQKRTTPSLNVKVGDKMFYGNLGDVIANSLRVKNGTKNYSVVNDNQ